MTSALPSADCLVPLERIVAFLPGADLDYALHIINKDLSVSNMSRKQRPFGCRDHFTHWNLGNHNIDLHFGQ